MPIRDASGALALPLFLLSFVSVAAGGEAAGQDRSIFGVGAGAVTRYSVVARYGNPEAPIEDRFEAAFLRPDGEAAQRAALLILPRGEGSSRDPQLAMLGFRKDGGLLGDQRNVLGPERADLVAALFASVEGPALKPGARWSDEESLALAYMPLDLTLRHEVVRLDDGRLALRSRVTEEKTVATLGYVYRLESWSREIVFSPGSLRPLEVEVELRSENQDPGEDPVPYQRRLRAELSEERVLAPEDSGSLADEIERIETVLKAMDPGRGSGGLLGSLFGGGAKPAAGEPLELLAAYEKAHPKGLLSPIVPVLRDRIVARNEREARAKALQAKADALLDAPAPDFTLEDLKGNKVSLSDLRGKAVLLVFWGYG